ncbi:MAG TPA: hypothetical protein VKE72_00805, partial [Methylocella sp.]|nr:hypothetical protein [Methylocella sp.]
MPVEWPATSPAVLRRLERGAGIFGITWENLGVNGIAAFSPLETAKRGQEEAMWDGLANCHAQVGRLSAYSDAV